MELMNWLAYLWIHNQVTPYGALSLLILIAITTLFVFSLPLLLATSSRQQYFFLKGLRSVNLVDKKIDYLSAQLATLQQHSQHHQQALQLLEKKMISLAEYLEAQPLSPPLLSSPSVAESHSTTHFARKLLDNGHTLEDVIRLCHLSEGEADVLRVLYENKSNVLSEMR